MFTSAHVNTVISYIDLYVFCTIFNQPTGEIYIQMKTITFNWHLKNLKAGERKFITCRRLCNEIYHKGKALSSTVIKDISNRSPNYIWHKHIKKDITDNRTPAFIIGSATHKWILERKDFYKEFAVWDKRRSGNEYKAFIDYHEGKEIITRKEFDEIKTYGDAVKKHPIARGLLSAGKAEHSVIWIDKATGIKMKARADHLTTNNVVIDLKTCTDISDEGLIKSIYNYGYYIQAHHYMEGFNGVAFVFIFVLKGPHPEVKVVHLSDRFLAMGAFVWEQNVLQYKEMLDEFGTEEWFGEEQHKLIELDAADWMDHKVLG